MSILTYKDYIGSVEVSEQDKLFYGKVQFIRALISYEGASFDEIQADFKAAVDDYLELCKEKGVEPEIPFKGSFNVRISPKTHRKLAIKALEKNESLNKFVDEILSASV